MKLMCAVLCSRAIVYNHLEWASKSPAGLGKKKAPGMNAQAVSLTIKVTRTHTDAKQD